MLLLEKFHELLQPWCSTFAQQRTGQRAQRLAYDLLICLRTHLTSNAICATGPSSRRKVIHRCGARPGLEPPSRHPPAPISGSHLQLAAVGFHGLWVSAHGRLSTPAVMETKVDSPFDLGSAESAARPNLRSPDAGSAHADYRRLRGVGARGRERRETATGFGDALHHGGLTILPGCALSRIWPISSGRPKGLPVEFLHFRRVSVCRQSPQSRQRRSAPESPIFSRRSARPGGSRPRGRPTARKGLPQRTATADRRCATWQ